MSCCTAVRNDDLLIITKGDRSGVEGQTNLMRIIRVGEHITDSNDKD